ncbi:MAG: site-specific integrase [Bacteroidales bacterium]|nr:site-specific integrase [Bacteroidales bacterium]
MNLSFSQVAQLWKEEKRLYVKKSSYAVYALLLQRHILPRFGGGAAPEEAAVQAWVNGMLAKGYSIKTVKDCLLVLKMVRRHGARLGAWPQDDCQIHFPSVSGQKSVPAVLSRHEQRKLIDYLQEHFSFRNLGILICLQSGLRIGEVCGLQWQDLDTRSGVLRVRRTVQRIYLADGAVKEYTISIGTPKTASSLRDIPLSRELLARIRPLTKLMRPQDYVLSNSPEPLEPRYYRDYYHKLLLSLDITPLRFHSLRHSFATRCIEGRCDYKTVSAILGHASIATTMDLYVHPGLDDKRRCIERMARCLKAY